MDYGCGIQEPRLAVSMMPEWSRRPAINLSILTLVVSVGFQLLASLMAIRLIKLTGKSGSWIFISGALLLMSIRRIIPLYAMIEYNTGVNFFNEIIGLVLSILMFLGIVGIKALFLERKRAEETVKAMLSEKEMILKEVHHRLKNNMNTLISLLNLQAGTLSDPAAINALQEAGARIRSMMLLYEQLNKSDDFLQASVCKYLSAVIDSSAVTCTVNGSIKIEKVLEDLTLDTRRLQTLGIIINELLTNSFKYAFCGRASGVLTISLSGAVDKVVLKVRDNGIGIPESIDFRHSTGLGLQLVHALADQLDGTVRLERNKGTTVILEFDKQLEAIH